MFVIARRNFVHVEGIEELIEMFKEMEDEAIKALNSAVSETAEVVLSYAKRYVVKKTGKLHNSLDKVKVKSKKNTRVNYNVISKGVRKGGVRYGFVIELGTNKIKQKPFLRPAVDKNLREIGTTLNTGIVKALNRIN